MWSITWCGIRETGESRGWRSAFHRACSDNVTRDEILGLDIRFMDVGMTSIPNPISPATTSFLDRKKEKAGSRNDEPANFQLNYPFFPKANPVADSKLEATTPQNNPCPPNSPSSSSLLRRLTMHDTDTRRYSSNSTTTRDEKSNTSGTTGARRTTSDPQ